MSEQRQAPKRRVQVSLELGADSWGEVASTLRGIAWEIEAGRHRSRVMSGGYGSGYIFEASENEGVTHDSYFAALDEYLADEAAALSGRSTGETP